MPKITIPKEFKLGPYTITVNKESDLCYKSGASGMAYLNAQEIGLQPSVQGFNMKPESVLQVMHHELVHWILYMMKKDELNSDESFVDQFADFLTQYVITSKQKLTELEF